jgi:hypothetical protein
MALEISKKADLYAYDAYFLACAIKHKAPLLTLDRKLKVSAHHLNVKISLFRYFQSHIEVRFDIPQRNARKNG